jgi:phosphatidylserine decarboxylase
VAGGERIVVSPVDARVAGSGVAEEGRLLQAKGIDYSLSALLNDPIDGRAFEGGAWLTLYLAPKDYHRIHAPLDAEIEGYSYIPGTLWPVNAAGTRLVKGLFCANERLVTFLRTAAGRVAVVKVGAMCVGRIRACYDDVVTNAGRGASRRRYERTVPVKKGEELAVFELGSTVILLFEPGRVALEPSLVEGARVRMGQAIAQVV